MNNNISSSSSLSIDSLIKNESFEFFNSSFKYLIFQIGFDKCGTTSLFQLFKLNNIESRHWMHNQIRRKIRDNYLKRERVLNDLISNGVKYFGDFTNYLFGDIPELLLPSTSFNNNRTKYMLKHPYLYLTFYEIINHDYNINTKWNVFYILNIRNINHWLKSRYLFPRIIHLELRKKIKNIDIVYIWRSIWYKYICDLLKWFHDKQLMNRLLIFDIEHDKINKLIDFFAKYGIKLNEKFYKHGFPSPLRNDTLHTEWQQIEALYPEFAYNMSDGFNNEWDRIQSICIPPHTVHNTITDQFQEYIITNKGRNDTFVYQARDNVPFCSRANCQKVDPQLIWLPE